MHVSVGRVVIGAAAAIWLVVASAVATMAQDSKGTLAIVNGTPGKRVDVCLDGREIGSGLRYGRVVLRDAATVGSTSVRFLVPDPRRCRGDLVAQATFTLDPGEDLTVVLTRKAPRVVVWDNVGLGTIPPLGVPWEDPDIGLGAYRSAADLAVNLRVRVWTPGGDTPVEGFPTAAQLWTKGYELKDLYAADEIHRLRATLPGGSASIADAGRVLIQASHRYEWILVGTKPGNARFVLLDRVTSQAPE
jgi:hypothetical protein